MSLHPVVAVVLSILGGVSIVNIFYPWEADWHRDAVFAGCCLGSFVLLPVSFWWAVNLVVGGWCLWTAVAGYFKSQRK